MPTATTFWIEEPGRTAFRRSVLAEPESSEVLVHTLFSGISRGTESLVFLGRVPDSERDRMRAPFMQGAFPAPVAYGYMAVGRVETGPDELLDRIVFCLHPHQDRFIVPAEAVTPLPDGLPPERAVLAANMETALNVLWDAQVAPGDRVAVIGAGVIGALVAKLAASVPGTDVTLVDVLPARAYLANRLGVTFATPKSAPEECDVVIHTSATASGLAAAVAAAGFEARIVEASWHGAGETPVALGGAFHSRRLALVSSQVGTLPAGRRGRWTPARRMAKALDLLRSAPLDALISGESAFPDLVGTYAEILQDPATLCHRIRYD
jgi:NADPH:quinone reductase-like Zn-dependent oxidoreductase